MNNRPTTHEVLAQVSRSLFSLADAGNVIRHGIEGESHYIADCLTPDQTEELIWHLADLVSCLKREKADLFGNQ